MSTSDVRLFDEIARWDVAPGGTGAEQMALDELMLRLADRPVVRLYRWAQSEVTFGYPQRWEEARAFAGGRPLTRRCTGGGFVEHGADLTIALAVPAAHPFAQLAPGEAYRRIHEAVRCGLDADSLRLATAEDCAAGPACFASPAPHDLLRGGRKILGGAQRRSREGFLYQGSLQGVPAGGMAGAFGRTVGIWQPANGWELTFGAILRHRYGADAWNRRRL